MKTEIEVKFVDIDIEVMRQKLQVTGALLKQPMRLMRREVFHLVTPNKDAFVRVRDEGNKVTMTYKRFEGDGLHAAKEAEVIVDDYDTAVQILKGAGLVSKSYQETKRETWAFDGVEVVIDEWPWIEPFIEIEGADEEGVRATAQALDLNWDDAVFGCVASVYTRKYEGITSDVIVNDYPRYEFNKPVPKEFGK